MSFTKRLLFVCGLVLASGVGFVGPSDAIVDVPAATIVVPCNLASDSFSLTTAPSGTYRAVVVGACNWAGSRPWGATTGTPCSLGAPCVTTTVANMPGDTCGTTTGFVRVEACGAPVSTAGDCTLQVLVNGTCLTVRGTQGLISHSGGAFRAVFQDSGHFDNTGAFLVIIEPI